MSKHQKNIVTVNGSMVDDSRLQEHITEALKMPSNTARFIGTITGGPDHAGTTIFVTSGGRQFLAFVDLKNPVKPWGRGYVPNFGSPRHRCAGRTETRRNTNRGRTQTQHFIGSGVQPTLQIKFAAEP